MDDEVGSEKDVSVSEGHDVTALDDDDPVIDEYDVYINRLISDPESGKSALIYLLQYPLRPVYRPYGDHGQLCSIEKGINTNKLRLKYSLNIEGNEYSESKRRLLEEFLERKEAKKTLDEEEEIQLEAMRYSRLVSTEAKNQGQCEYGLAFKKDKRLYITPVSQVLQFRPDFSHQDAIDELKARRGADYREQPTSNETGTGEANGEDETENSTSGDVTPTTGGGSETNKSNNGKRSGTSATSPGALDMSSVNSRIKLSHAETRKKELGEQYTAIDTFYDADSPEGAELLTLLSSFPVKYRVEIAEDLMESRINDLFDLTGGGSDSMNSGSGIGGTRYEIRTRRMVHSPQIPNIICESSFDGYLDALCKDCSLSTLAGTTTQLKETASAASFGPTGVGTGPLSYLALSKLNLENQIRRIMRIREMEKYDEVRALVTTSKSITDEQFIEMLLRYAVPIHGNWIVRSEVLWDDKPEDRSYKCDFTKSKWTEVELLTRDLVLCFYAVGVELAKPAILKSTGCPPERLNQIIKTIYIIRDGKYQPRTPPDNEFKRKFGALCVDHENRWGRERVADLQTKCEQMKLKLASSGGIYNVGGTASSSKDVDDLLDLLDRIRVKTCVENILTREGASTEPFILARVKAMLQNMVEQEMKTSLAASINSAGAGAPSTAQLLDHHNKLKSGIAALQETHLKEILIDCATEFRKLWILQRHRNKQLDEYRQALLNMYRQNSERGITKADFKEECLRIFRKPFDLPDMQYRNLMKEIAVNQEGYWYYKGSDVVQDSNEKPDET